MILEKYAEIKIEYFNAISESYEDYKLSKKNLIKYTDKLKYMTKKYSRLREKIESLKYKREVNNFLATEDNNIDREFTNTIKDELSIFQDFTSYQKEESQHYKLANIMRSAITDYQGCKSKLIFLE